MELKRKELVAICIKKKLGISGKKDKLAKRIVSCEEHGNDEVNVNRDIEMFVRVAGKPMCTNNEKPKLNQFYADTFNHVDRYNKLISFIHYRPRFPSESMRLLISLIEISIVQSWVIFQAEAVYDENKSESLRTFAISLSNDLYEISLNMRQ